MATRDYATVEKELAAATEAKDAAINASDFVKAAAARDTERTLCHR